MTEAKTYTGGCHCGKVRYEVKAGIQDVVSCNCSICMKTGSFLAFVPAAAVTVLSGGDVVTDYQFGKKHIHHQFCPSCGVRSFARGAMPDGTEMYAINVRTIDDVDLGAFKVKEFDGKSL
ncbi:MAG TPA: GFA family protein [Polyangium sp.]|uniref:GFA family protein n=1 Tax=Polyangium mundeleinium TaxID=2995306 RepID=A0ABT5EYW6_9BACT|nr:GFA family protein [Polyangium mundeleinium]MDC0746467.1 GFA family protein [Polyangium mundeleinium]HVK69118.1 GFA family protein [Polyangium sp.]